MDNKIFLGKYRISASEISAAGELTDSPLAYEGQEIESGKKVVVEVVPAAALKPAVREKLEAEAEAAKKLNHVNIPALYDFGVEDDHLVYVTEDFEGTLAEEWVNAHGPMPVGPVLRIAAQVVSALGAAAVQRISHHAINPSNLVLVPGQTAEGEWPLIKVLHFVGVAPKVFGERRCGGRFRQSLALREPGTNPAWRGRFPVGDLFARVHDVVPFDRRPAADDAQGADGRATDANRPGSNGTGSGQDQRPPEKDQAFVGPNVVAKSRGAPARSARILPAAPGLPGPGGTARDNIPQVRSSGHLE